MKEELVVKRVKEDRSLLRWLRNSLLYCKLKGRVQLKLYKSPKKITSFFYDSITVEAFNSSYYNLSFDINTLYVKEGINKPEYDTCIIYYNRYKEIMKTVKQYNRYINRTLKIKSSGDCVIEY